MAPRIFIAFIFAVFIAEAQAIDLRYDSGYPKAVSFEDYKIKTPEMFFEKEFPNLRNTNWKLSKEQEDGTHLHLTYDLFFGEAPVFEQHLKLHWNKKEQAIDYATSTLEKDFEVEEAPHFRPSWETIQEAAAAKLFNRRNFQGLSRGKWGLWLNENKDKASWAYDVEAVPRGPEMGKRGIVSADLSTVFEEKKVIRHWREEAEEGRADSVSLKVWLKFPTVGLEGSGVNKYAKSTGSSTATQSSLTSSALENAFTKVCYDTPDQSCNEVSGNTSSLGLTLNHDQKYGHDCSNKNDTCMNQKVDAGNVFHHLTEFRNTTLKNTSGNLGVNLSLSSIPVYINYMTKAVQDCQGFKPSRLGQSDNAAYYSGGCDEEGAVPRCLIFLRNAVGDPAGSCYSQTIGGSTAREALIVAHEYQHYVTDMISGVEYGAVNVVILGDVIHEGYSDYFGAVYSDERLVGKFAFQNRTSFQRNLYSEEPLSQTKVYTSGHEPGLVWASSLWELRGELGNTLVDNIAFKSLYYLSTSPGFIDSVEALVQADRALTGGVNGDRIRTLFYDERKFIGTLANIFQDGDKKIVKVGFQGCASVKEETRYSMTVLNWLALIGWVFGTFWVGKKAWRRTA